VKVLAVSSYGSLGGSELALVKFLEHRPDDVEAEVVVLSEGPLTRRLRDAAIPSVSLHGLRGRPGLRELGRFTRAFDPIVRRSRPDVVWAVGQKAALLAAPTCRWRRVPLAWHKVDFSWDRLLAKPLAAASTGVISCSHAVVAPLGPLQSRVRGVVWPPLHFDPTLRAQPDVARPVIGTLARLVPYKGHHHLLHAAALLSDEFPELRVVVAGGDIDAYPSYPDRLRTLAADLGLGDRAEFTGFLDDVAPVLRRLSVFVNATYRDDEGFGLEGLGAGTLEASWAGIPVVTTSGGGSGEAVLPGVTGTLVASPEPGLLAEAIAPYLRDPRLAEATGLAGMKFAREGGLDPEVAAARLFGLLRGVAQGAGHAPASARP